jgi:hypothetical protein
VKSGKMPQSLHPTMPSRTLLIGMPQNNRRCRQFAYHRQGRNLETNPYRKTCMLSKGFGGMDDSVDGVGTEPFK